MREGQEKRAGLGGEDRQRALIKAKKAFPFECLQQAVNKLSEHRGLG
jgi:hypothetical protein